MTGVTATKHSYRNLLSVTRQARKVSTVRKLTKNNQLKKGRKETLRALERDINTQEQPDCSVVNTMI